MKQKIKIQEIIDGVFEKNKKYYFSGCLDLGNTQIKALPENLFVGGSLYLRNTQIKTLPENLSVIGCLDLGNTQIKTLPENLSVIGCLDLGNTQIKTLPENLSVIGCLDLSNTQIKTLPENLSVIGCLNLRNTQIQKIKKEDLGEHERTGHAFFWKGEVWFSLGCWLGKYQETLKAVEGKYGLDSDYYASIKAMNNDLLDLLKTN